MKKATLYLKKHWAGIFIVMLILIAFLMSGISWVRQLQAPQDLGPQMSYVGRKDFGCVLWWCETQKYSMYYFATDMEDEALKVYFDAAIFKRSERQEPSDVAVTSVNEVQFYFGLKSQDRQGFTLSRYDNTDYVVQTYKLRKTGKKYIVEVLDSSYETAKSVL